MKPRGFITSVTHSFQLENPEMNLEIKDAIGNGVTPELSALIESLNKALIENKPVEDGVFKGAIVISYDRKVEVR
jgi:hypothetical protein